MVEKASRAFAPAERDALVIQLEMARHHGLAVLPDGRCLYSPMMRERDEDLVVHLSTRLAEVEARAA